MERSVEVIRGDVPGTAYSLAVHRFAGTDPAAPSAYLQAALHGDELPGVAALHMLMPMLRRAEAEGRIRGAITVVPQANPIGAGQHLFGEQFGRFAFGTRVNFNRDFPLLPTTDTSDLPGDDAPVFAEVRLKALLVKLALGHDLVLDLHCDSEGLSYLYVPRPFWPGMADLAAALGCRAVIHWDDGSDGAFEEAAYAPWRGRPADDPVYARKAVTTVELRGQADVSPALAAADAWGLYAFLVGRGTIADDDLPPPDPFDGLAVPIEQVEMVRAPAGGAVLFEVEPGDVVAAGQPVAIVLAAPGEADGAVPAVAPQAGLVLTRRSNRLTRIGDDLVKILGSARSTAARPGALED